jgi:hypothetical protein
MVTKTEMFPSRFLIADNLKGKPVVLTIKSATVEILKDNKTGRDQDKLVLSFDRTEKLLPLNVTNFDAVVDVTGEDDSDRWVGHRIEVFPTTTRLGAKTVACIRIRKPSRNNGPVLAEPEPSEPEGKFGDKPNLLAASNNKPTTADFDDEIPF